MARFSRRSTPFRGGPKSSSQKVLYKESLIERIMNTKIGFFILIFMLGFVFLMMFAPAGAFSDFQFSLQYFMKIISGIFG